MTFKLWANMVEFSLIAYLVMIGFVCWVRWRRLEREEQDRRRLEERIKGMEQ